MSCKQMLSISSLLHLQKQTEPEEMIQSYTGLPSDWYQKEAIIYSFSHPHVMSRLERLMGTNIVVLTDRKYMLELQRRIQEDHVNAIKERIKEREKDELNREKNLILEGKIPLTEAPQELVDHPVFRITQMANDFIKELNEKSKKRAPKVSQPDNDDNPCSVLDSHYQRPRQRAASVAPPQNQRLRYSMYSSNSGSEDSDDEEDGEESSEKSERREKKERPSEDSDIQNGYVFRQEQYDRLHYETDHVKAMWMLETVEDLYDMADQVVKDVVAHRPHEGDVGSQPLPPSATAEDSDTDIDKDTPLETQSPRTSLDAATKTGMKLSKAKSKEEKSAKKHRFSWTKKK